VRGVKTLKKNNIKYYSTNGKSPEVSFREALLKGLAPDGGLYLPDSIPVFTGEELGSFSNMSYNEIASLILNKFIGKEVDRDVLSNLCKDAYNFDIPLEKVSRRKYIMRLDRGPTASFKDFAARMMSRLMQHFLSEDNQHLTILTATSGDTGSAVASAFHGLKNINVIILFPANEVSAMQRKQMTTLNDNISVVAVNGKFDDCQAMLKRAFQDKLLSPVPLSSANSINIGRLLPQSVYYVYAWSRLCSNPDEKAIFSVPSGNFGNLMGGLISSRMGLPVEKFIVATNSNDEVPEFLKTGVYRAVSPSKNCISSAMNVGHPSNLARIVSLFGGAMDQHGTIIENPDLEQMQKELFGVSVTDDETRTTIKEVFRKDGIIIEPHGAVAWKGIEEYIKLDAETSSEKQLFISLETAHPAKFPEEMKPLSVPEPVLPDSLNTIGNKSESFISIDNNYIELRKLISEFTNKLKSF
jgi:threonine synthase